MRIIAGQLKGRRVELPRGVTARPTPDRVREALFSILGASMQGMHVLDLFAGSGCIGLEALSRGAQYVAFGEADSKTLANLKGYLEQFQVPAMRYDLLCGDFRKSITHLERQGKTFDYVYLDPPYAQGLYEAALMGVGTHLLKPQGQIIAEHDAIHSLPDTVGPLHIAAVRRYGTTSLTFYERGPKDENLDLPG